MKTEKKLTNDERILELLELLAQNNMQEKANAAFELCAYMDGLQKQLDTMTQELIGVRKELKEMKEQNLPKQLKEQEKVVTNHLKEQSEKLQNEVNTIREQIATKAGEIVDAVKQKGKDAFGKMSEFLGLGKKLENVCIKVQSSIRDVDNTIEKMKEFGMGIRNANQQIANTFRTAMGKEVVDYTGKEKRFSKTEVVIKPWQARRALLGNMEKHLIGAIDKLKELSQEKEHIRKEEKVDNQDIEKVEGEVVDVSMVADGEYQYGAELFEQQLEKEKGKGDLKEMVEKVLQKSEEIEGKGRR